MPIGFACICGKRLRANDAVAGLTIACPACRARMIVPDRPEAMPDLEIDLAVEPIRPEGMRYGRRARRPVETRVVYREVVYREEKSAFEVLGGFILKLMTALGLLVAVLFLLALFFGRP
jgi:hypothetical protein